MVEVPNQDGSDYADHQTQTRRKAHGLMPDWLALALAVASVASTFSGITFWAINGWLIGVILSALLPGFGFVSILVSVLS